MAEPLIAAIPLPTDDPAATLTHRFRDVVRAFPDRIALARTGQPLTYAALDSLTSRLAAALQHIAPAPGARVGILLSDALDAAAAFLAILRAGHVAILLDPDSPPSRIAAGLPGLHLSAIIGAPSPAIDIPCVPFSSDNTPDTPPSEPSITSDHPACIFFTSGSTGDARGVALSHRCLLITARNYIANLEASAGDRIAWTSPPSAGATLLPILTALGVGASLHRFDIRREGVAGLRTWLDAERISIWSTIPSLFRAFAETLPPNSLPHLRMLKLGGEPVLASDAALFESRVHAGCTLANGLGITECGGNICWHRHRRGTSVRTATIPIGKPTGDMDVSVQDECLVVRSHAIGLGYWNAATGAIVPFSAPGPDGSRTYVTADRARFDDDGNLVHLGRADGLLKLHGQRIDRALVEETLLAHPAIKDAAVEIRGDPSGDRLVAWVVWRGPAPSASALRESLSRTLPSHHVPARFIPLNVLPRLPGGKIDRRQLASQPLPETAPTSPHPGARDALERQMLMLWEKALGRSGLTMEDDFFESGGDSLSAVRLFALLDQHIGVNLPLSTLSQHRTPHALAEFIRARHHHAALSCAHLLRAGDHAAPLFCVPGAGADTMSLIPLAQALDPGQTVYAMQYAGLADGEACQRRVEEMAARFVGEIRRIQPTGPYYLAGTSFGGRVAFEMASQLSRAGEKIGLLALLDAFGPGYPRRHPHPTLRRRALHALRWWLPRERQETLTLENLRAGIRQRFTILAALSWPVLRPGKPMPRNLRYNRLIYSCFRSRKHHRPAPYTGGPIHLFRAETQPPSALFETPRDMHWGPLAAGGLIIHDIPGRHGEHIRPPHVRELGRQLQACLPRDTAHADGRFTELNERNRQRWSDLAAWWDEQCGDEGHADTRDLLLPPSLRLLTPRPGEHVIDAGCGNGWIARRLARQGIRVMAFDFCGELIDRARRHPSPASVTYHCIDATRPEQLAMLGENIADSALCHMVLMDVADLQPLLTALHRAVRPGGRLVFSIIHPESGGFARASDCQALTNPGKPGQPVMHYYFHRPLPILLKAFEQTGWLPDLLMSPQSSSGERFLIGRLIRAPA